MKRYTSRQLLFVLALLSHVLVCQPAVSQRGSFHISEPTIRAGHTFQPTEPEAGTFRSGTWRGSVHEPGFYQPQTPKYKYNPHDWGGTPHEEPPSFTSLRQPPVRLETLFSPAAAENSARSKPKIYIAVANGEITMDMNVQHDHYSQALIAKVKNVEDGIKQLATSLTHISALSHSPLTYTQAYSKFTQEADFVIDYHVFYKQPFFDIPEAMNVSVFCADGQVRKTREFENEDGTKQRIVQYQDNLYFHPALEQVAGVFEDLSNMPFRRDDIRLLSFEPNSETQTQIQQMIPHENRIDLNLEHLDDSTIRSAFSHNAERILIILGHIEHGEFVVLSSKNEVSYHKPLVDLVQLASEYGVTLLPLGCNSARYVSHGTAADFNSLVAIQHLSKALEASNYGEFLQSLSGAEIPLVIDTALVNGVRKLVVVTVLWVNKGKITVPIGSIAINIDIQQMSPRFGDRPDRRTITKKALDSATQLLRLTIWLDLSVAGAMGLYCVKRESKYRKHGRG